MSLTINKEPPKILKTIEGINLEIEIPFWKIFRYKVIFLKIFSNFTNNRLYGYNDITSDVKTLFEKYNNPIEIIIDKIKCNSNYSLIKCNNDIKYIFSKVIKETKENRLFYNILFTKYSSLLSSSSSSETTNIIQLDNNKKEWIEIIIRSSNLVAFQEFIKLFNIGDQLINECVESIVVKEKIYERLLSIKKINFYSFLISNNYLPSSSNIIDINSFDYSFLSFYGNFKKIIKAHKFITSQFYNQNNDKINQIITELNQINLIENPNFNEKYLKWSIIGILESNESNLQINENNTLKVIIYKYFRSIYKIYKLHNSNGQENYSHFKKNFYYYLYFKNTDLKFLYDKIQFYSKGTKDLSMHISALFNIRSKKERIELISSIFDNKNQYFGQLERSTLLTYSRLIIPTNDVDVIDHFFKKLSTTINSISETGYINGSSLPLTSQVIEYHIKDIRSKELMEYFYQNYPSESLFKQGYTRWNDLTKQPLTYGKEVNFSNVLENFENLMKSIDKKLTVPQEISYSLYGLNCIEVIKRIIQRPSYYEINGNNYKGFLKYLYESIITNGKKYEPIIYILSNTQLKNPLDLQSIPVYRKLDSMMQISKFLFNNISKETIGIALRELPWLNTPKNKFNLTNQFTNTDGRNTNGKGIDLGDLIIGEKPKSITFTISIEMLLYYLYYMDRFDDILYLYNTVPEILIMYHNNIKEDNNIYDCCSSFYLELFINYLTDKSQIVNEYSVPVIHHLYYCLMLAIRKGFIQLFKNLISNQHYSQLIFSIKTPTSNQQLFEAYLLHRLILTSIESNHFELSYLLIESINLSKIEIESFRQSISKKINLNKKFINNIHY